MKLVINRASSALSVAVPFKLKIDGRDFTKISNGCSTETVAPEKEFELNVTPLGNKLNLHKIESNVVIDPRQCKSGTITCTITPKMKKLGFLSGGFLGPMMEILVDVKY